MIKLNIIRSGQKIMLDPGGVQNEFRIGAL